MPQITLKMNKEEIKDLIFQLPPQDFLELANSIEERVETFSMMRLAETGFGEWDEEGEDIYDAQA